MTRFSCWCTLLASSLSLLACSDDGGGGSGGASVSATGVTSATSVTSATTNTTNTSNSGGTDGTSEGGSASASASDGTSNPTTGSIKLDVGAVDDTTTGGDQDKGCRKVDFLFIIDNSGSMGDEQQSLIKSFPGFIASIQSTLKDAQDYHLMVIDSDAWVFKECETLCPLFFNTCPPAGLDFMCGDGPLECEDVLGAGVVHPRGQDSSQKDCMFSSGARYMDVTEPDLTKTFACAAQVGTGSTDDPEKPMQAMVAAVAPTGEAHDCNLGFIRQDAILVVTFITDEDDDAGDGSAGTPEGWKASLVAAKKGDENALVVLGLYGDNDQPNPVCDPLVDQSGAEPSVRLRQFVESFGDHGISGSVCADNYDPFFAQAVALIETTCDEFVPPPM